MLSSLGFYSTDLCNGKVWAWASRGGGHGPLPPSVSATELYMHSLVTKQQG